MAIRNRSTDETAAADDREDIAADAPMEDFFGVPNDEEALALVSTHDEDGAVLSEGRREQIAGKIQEAAQAHVIWRKSLPVEQQLELAGQPVVFAPVVDHAGV
jgi:hypothetical protein